MRRKNYYNRKHAQKIYLIPKEDDNKKNYNIFYGDKRYSNAKFRKIKVENKKSRSLFNINLKFLAKLLFTLCILLLLVKNNLKKFLKLIKLKKNDKYFACFSGMGKLENNYIRELIEYYSNLGVEKFILADNNDPNTEKFSDVIQDYIDDGTVDILDIINVSYSQSELNNYTYEKYNRTCKWIMFFDFDEFLEVHFEDKKSLTLKQFLSNEIFDKCEAIEFNWVMYTDNNLLYYDDRPVLERFTEKEPNARKSKSGGAQEIKSMIRGKNPKVNVHCIHVIDRTLKVCDGFGNRKQVVDLRTLRSDYEYYYLRHYYSKSTEEFIEKIMKTDAVHAQSQGTQLFKIKRYFTYNVVTKAKLDLIENRTGLDLSGYRYRAKS